MESIEKHIEVDKETLKGGIYVADPNYKSTGNELNYNLSSIINDKPDSGFENKVISTGIGTRFEQYKDIYLSPRITFTHDDLSVLDKASAALKKQEGSFNDLTFDYSIGMDKRDRAFMPTDGFVSNFGQQIPLYADSPFLRNSYNFSAYNSFGADVIGAFKFYASAINGLGNDDVRISKRINLPSTRLRGFEYGKIGPKDGADYIGGNYVSALNLSSTLPYFLENAQNTDFLVFIDAANVWGVDYDSSIDESNKIRSSYGVGVDWFTPIGPLSFSLSQTLSKASTDKTESFRFDLGTTFWC